MTLINNVLPIKFTENMGIFYKSIKKNFTEILKFI